MEQAIAEGAQVLFATTPPLIAACRKIAVRHPGVRILNCSVSMPYTGVGHGYGAVENPNAGVPHGDFPAGGNEGGRGGKEHLGPLGNGLLHHRLGIFSRCV